MKITITRDLTLKAGTYDSDDARITMDAGGDSDSELTLDFQLAAPPVVIDPPPVDPPKDPQDPPVDPPADPDPPVDPVDPPKAPPVGAAGQPAPSVYPEAPPVSPVGDGVHLAHVEVIDGAGRVWFADGHVGDDRTAPGLTACLVNAAGDVHPRLQAVFYADGCHVHVARMDNRYDELGCMLTVTYDGTPAAVPPSSYADGTYDFWRGCWMPMIRYGKQLAFEDLAPIDWSVLPTYAGEKQLPPFDDSKMDYSWNGLGCAGVSAMGTTGERGDIGYMPSYYMSFLTNPTPETWAVVRRSEDHCGVWSMVFVSEPRGGIIRYTDYAMLTVLPAAQSAAWQSKNPIALYGGSYRGDVLIPPKDAWGASASRYKPNTAHLTGYGMLAAMMTSAAHDKDLASFWANYPQIDKNPGYTRATGIVDEPGRYVAWALRSLFIAAYHSSDTEFFNAELDRNLALINAVPKNPFGIFPKAFAYPGAGAATGYSGLALWMQSYLAMTVEPVQRKRPEWRPFAQWLGKLEVTYASYPFAFLRTLYAFICYDTKAKTLLTDFVQMVRLTCYTNGFSEEDTDAILNATTVEDSFAAYVTATGRNGKTPFGGKCVNGAADFAGYLKSTDSYPAGAIASIISAANAGTPEIETAVHIAMNQPTPIDFTRNQKYHYGLRQVL